MSSDVDDRLNWLAMQYVLGELSESDCDAFEQRMADDLTACEAVAEASRIRLTLHAALSQSKAGTQVGPLAAEAMVVHRSVAGVAPHSWYAIVASLSAVACLFVAMIFGSRYSIDSGSTETRVASHSNHAAVELVARWRTEMKLADVEADDADDDLHENAAADIAVPGWLLAGVSLEKHGTVDGQPKALQDN